MPDTLHTRVCCYRLTVQISPCCVPGASDSDPEVVSPICQRHHPTDVPNGSKPGSLSLHEMSGSGSIGRGCRVLDRPCKKRFRYVKHRIPEALLPVTPPPQSPPPSSPPPRPPSPPPAPFNTNESVGGPRKHWIRVCSSHLTTRS